MQSPDEAGEWEAGSSVGAPSATAGSLQSDNNQANQVESLFRELEGSINHDRPCAAIVNALLMRAKQLQVFLSAHPSIASDSVLSDVCTYLRRCIPIVRRVCHRGVIGGKFWSRLDRIALQEQQIILGELMTSIMKEGESDEEEEEKEAEDTSGMEHQQLIDTLKPTEFDPYALVEEENGYEMGTREGVFTAVSSWMNSSDESESSPPPPSFQRLPSSSAGGMTTLDKSAENRHRMIWIQGGPGTGKTTIQSALCRRYASSVLAVHFCKHQTSRSSWLTMIKSLAFQISERVPEYRALLIQQMASRAADGGIAAMSALELFQILLTGLLCQIPDRPQLQEIVVDEEDEEQAGVEAGPGGEVASSSSAMADDGQGKLLLLIDALDESDSATHPELLLLFKETWQWPSWIGMILSSRPVAEHVVAVASSAAASSSSSVSTPSRDYVLVELSYESAETEHDMSLFVGRRLEAILPHASIAERAAATAVICARSSGMFLFSRLVLQEYEEQMNKYRYQVQQREEKKRQAMDQEKMKEGQREEGEGDGSNGTSFDNLPALAPPALDAHSLEKLPLGLDDYFRQTMQRVADGLAAAQSEAAEEKKTSASSSSSASALVTLAEIMRLLRVVLAAQEPLSVHIVSKLLGWSSLRVLQCLEPLRALFPLTAVSSSSSSERDQESALISSTHKSVCDWLSSSERLNHLNEKQFWVDIQQGHLLLAMEGWKILTKRNPQMIQQNEWMNGINEMRVDAFVNSVQPTPLLVDECAAAASDSLLAYTSRFQAVHALHACHLPLLLACLTHLSFIEIRLRGQQSSASDVAAAVDSDSSSQPTPAANANDVSQSSRRGHQLLKEYHLAITMIKAELNARSAGVGEGNVAAPAADEEEEDLLNAPAAAAVSFVPFEASKYRLGNQSGSSVYQSLLSASVLLQTFYRFVRAEVAHFGPNPILVYQDAYSYPSVSPLFVQAAQLRSWWASRCDWCEWLNKPDSDRTDPCLLVLQGHTASVDCCVFVRDLIVSASDDASIRVWDSVSGEVRGVLVGHRGPVSCLHYRSDLHRLYSAGSDGLIRIFDMDSMQCVQEMQLDGQVLSIDFSPSKRKVVFGITNQRVQIMQATEDGLIDESTIIAVINEGEWCSCALFHDEDVLVIATERSLELWQVSPQPTEDGTVIGAIPVQFQAGQHQMERLLHGSTISSLERLRTKDQTFYITGSHDEISYLFNFKPSNDGSPHLNRLTCLQHDLDCGQSASIKCIKFAPYGRLDRPLYGLHPEVAAHEERKDAEEEGEEARGYHLRVRVAVSYVDNSVRVYELSLIDNVLSFVATGLFLCHTYASQCVSWSSDGTLLVSSSQDSRLAVWDTRTHGIRRPREELGEAAVKYPGHQDAITALCITPDGRHIVSGGIDGTVRVWQPQDAVQPLVRVIQYGHVAPISCIAITPYRRWDEGYVIASGSEDRMVRVFRLSDGRLLDSVISHHSGQILRLASSSSGALLASASTDCTTRIWNTTTGRVEHSLCRGKIPMTAVAIMPIPNSNNQKFPGLILTGNARGQLQIWTAGEWSQLEESVEDSIGSARLLLESTVHSESIVCIHVCHTYSVFCTVSAEGVIRVWQWDWEMHLQPAAHAQNNGVPQRKKGDLSPCLRSIQALPRWPQLQANVACITADTDFLLFAGSQHPALCFYNLQTRQLDCVSILPGAASCMVASRTSSRIYVGDTKGSVSMHDPHDPREPQEGDDTPQIPPIWNKQCHERRITAIDINKAETLLCTGSFDNSVHIYTIIDAAADPAANPPIAAGRARGGLMIQSEVRVHFSPVNSLCFNPSGSLIWLCGELASNAGSDGNDLVWEIDVESSKVKRIWSGEFEAVKSMSWQNWQHRAIPSDYDEAKAEVTSEDDEREILLPQSVSVKKHSHICTC